MPQVDEVVSVIKRALYDAQATIRDAGALPPLEAVTLTLQTTTTRTAGGTVKVVVVSVGGEAEFSNSQQLTIRLTPPSPNMPKPIAADNSTYQTLVDAIVGASDAARRARAAAQGPPNPLTLNTISTEIAMSIKKTIIGSAGIDIQSINIGPKGSIASLALNKIAVSYKTP